jgi:hypothetical protein
VGLAGDDGGPQVSGGLLVPLPSGIGPWRLFASSERWSIRPFGRPIQPAVEVPSAAGASRRKCG